MKKTRRHPEYWNVRFMLAFAILAPPVVLFWLLALQPETMGGGTLRPGLDWLGLSILAVGAALWLTGVIWMIRIFRGPRDEPPAWRYRDR